MGRRLLDTPTSSVPVPRTNPATMRKLTADRGSVLGVSPVADDLIVDKALGLCFRKAARRFWSGVPLYIPRNVSN
jgi:hypothetical protein